MALNDDDAALVRQLSERLAFTAIDDQINDEYYEGSQALARLGIAVPPELKSLRTVVNWPRLVVDAVEERCDVKSFIRGGDDKASAELRDLWDANNLDSEFHMAAIDSLVHGRGFLSVGANEDDPEFPLIMVESPREMAVNIDPRRRRVSAALKLYGTQPNDIMGPIVPPYATLYEPDSTTWLERDGDEWGIVDRDDHKIGRVMVVPLLNRPRTARWLGESEMADAKSLTDSACRILTNLQVAAETHAVPQRWALGVSKGDFVGADGEQLPVWQAYFGAIWSAANKDAKFGQFSASDLRNFHETVDASARWLSGEYGLPLRYFGQNTANPPSADGIRADEARLVKRAERKMMAWGDQIGRVMAYALRVRDGEFPESGDRIKVEWHDAATPTYAARVDGIQKLTGGQPILSREGGWDELGWSDARKDRERQYLAAEARDPVLERVARDLVGVPANGEPDAAVSGV